MRLIWPGSDPGQDAVRVLVLIAGIRGSTLIPIEVYLVYIQGPPIQKFGEGTDLWAGTTEERPRGRGPRGRGGTTVICCLSNHP